MGLYEQPNSWQCGPFALKHGLLAHGLFAHEDALARAAGSTEAHGTDERQLMGAARDHGCVLRLERYHTAHTARRALLRLLGDHIPVLLCVDQWDHWVTAVGADDAHVVVLDSHYDTVVRLELWDAYLRRVGYPHRLGGWGPRVAWYDLHPLLARGETGMRMALTTERARHLLATPAEIRMTLADRARQLAPFATRAGRRSGSVALGPWIAEFGAQRAPAVSAQTLEAWAFTAEIFEVRCDTDRLPEVIRLIAGSVERPAVPSAYAKQGSAVPVAT
ncbi:MAG: hypothetical protein OEY20_07980 [Gemmatimonadota bacterium]|nr:hypothetical protein [Gemmatimonadota bacterium]MDH4349669.1 hypothetical protein [Gemmatimonadota bacterium]MDH5197173.1 hypothetical protein [Gemmatimonadota bacterium]